MTFADYQARVTTIKLTAFDALKIADLSGNVSLADLADIFDHNDHIIEDALHQIAELGPHPLTPAKG